MSVFAKHELRMNTVTYTIQYYHNYGIHLEINGE